MLLTACLFSWIFGIFLSGYLVPNILVFILPPFFLFVVLAIRRMLAGKLIRNIPGYSLTMKATLCILLCALGAGRYFLTETRGYLDALSFQKEQPATLSGVIVSEVSRYDTTDYFYLKEDSGRKIRVSVRTQKPLMTGQRVTLWEPTLTPVNIYNTKIQSTRRFLGNGATLTATFPYQATVEEGGIGNPLLYYAKLARTKMGDLLEQLFPEEIAGFLTSLLSSDKSGLSDELYQDFISTGSIHILVVSGMHFNYLTGAILCLLGFFCHSRRKKLLLTIPLLLAFCIFTGGTLPVLRAFCMTLLLFLGDLFYWKRLNSQILVTALASVFLLVSPTLILNPSFLLTFGATLGITCFYEPFQKFLKRIPGSFLRSYLSIQLSVQVFTLPVICFFFSRIPTISILTNFLVGPLVPVVLVLAMLVPLVFRIPLISTVVLTLTQWNSQLFLWCVKSTAKLLEPWKLSCNEYTFLLLMCLGVGFFFLKNTKNLRRKIAAGILCVGMLGVNSSFAFFPPTKDSVSITFFGASNTNSATITTQNNRLIVYGSMKDIFYARYTAAFREETPIDLLILTDFSDPDLLTEFLKTHTVSQVALPKSYRELWNHPCPVQFCDTTLYTEIDGVTLTLVTDGKTFLDAEFSYQDTIFSFTSDAEYLLENWNQKPKKYWIYNFRRTGTAARSVATLSYGERLFSKKQWHPDGILYDNTSIIQADHGVLTFPGLAE